MAGKLADIMAAIRSALDIPGIGTAYDTYAAPNLAESDFPVVVFDVSPVDVSTSFGAATKDDLFGTMALHHFSLSPEGPAGVRAMAEITIAALHRKTLTASGWGWVQLRAVRRGAIEPVGAGMLTEVDEYEIRAEVA